MRDSDAVAGLLEPVMRGGKRIRPRPTLDAIRQRAQDALRRLPEALRRLEKSQTPVDVSGALRKLADELDAAAP